MRRLREGFFNNRAYFNEHRIEAGLSKLDNWLHQTLSKSELGPIKKQLKALNSEGLKFHMYELQTNETLYKSRYQLQMEYESLRQEWDRWWRRRQEFLSKPFVSYDDLRSFKGKRNLKQYKYFRRIASSKLLFNLFVYPLRFFHRFFIKPSQIEILSVASDETTIITSTKRNIAVLWEIYSGKNLAHL